MENNNDTTKKFPNPLDLFREKLASSLGPKIVSHPIPEINGQTPVIIMGGTNTINVIRNQYNDQSAVKTCKERLEQQRRSDELQKTIVDTVLGMAPGMIAEMMKMSKSKDPVAPQPSAPQPGEASAKRKYTKTKSKK